MNEFESDNDENGIEATIWRIVRAGYLRAALHGTTRRPEELDDAEANAVLDRLHMAIENDVAMLMEVVRRGEYETRERMRHALHSAPGVDHEMLDQAISFAAAPSGGTSWRPS